MTLNLKSTIKGFLEPLKSIKDTVLLLSRISDMDPLAAFFSSRIQDTDLFILRIQDSDPFLLKIQDTDPLYQGFRTRDPLLSGIKSALKLY